MTAKHDAIVVGAGAAGGLAAALLCERGLSVLLLDAGSKYPFWKKPLSKSVAATIGSVSDPRLARVLPPRAINAAMKVLRGVGRVRQPVQTECFAWVQKPDGFVDDKDHPYETPPDKPFNWIRSHGVGGRMVVPGHGRQYYRFGETDLGPKTDSPSPWPFGIGELEPWYQQVERRLHLTGAQEGIGYIPDSVITQAIAPSASETVLFESIRSAWPEAPTMLSRYAPPVNFAGIAEETGHLTLRAHALAQRVLAGPDGRASGVEWLDPLTGQRETAEAPLVFLCASSLESTRILLNSGTPKGALSDQLPALGGYLTDHVMVKAEGVSPALPMSPEVEAGRCVYLPRFDLRTGGNPRDRGYGVQLYATVNVTGSWTTAVAFGESAPAPENRVSLSKVKTDKWGAPLLRIEMQWGERERALAASMSTALTELFDTIGAKVLVRPDRAAPPGTSVHECGGARLGRDAQTSVLTPHNECWAMPGLYVTDGAALPSQGIQNPTLTIMALTARACAHATGAAAVPAP
ncbi:GMC oxidoreductase [Hyphomonas sp. NPDC076900]|uniref:GMC oxidoreductase n=1 Tax=unclassified Hyphomonas TaxID=2630699 RepID=UPI003D047111